MLSPSEVPYDSVLWTFVSTDTLVTDTVSEKGDTLWSGILVAAGGVTAELHIGSTSTQVASSYSVTDRPWTWTSSHVDTAQAALGQFDGCFTTEIGLTVGTDCVAYGPGNLFTPGSLAAGFSMDTATGPNAGLWYVSSASKGMFLRSQVAKKLRSDATKYSVTGDATVINDCTATFGTPIPPQNIRGVNHDCRQTPGYNQLWDSAWAHESAHMDTALVEANLPVNDLHAAWQLLLANDSSTLDYRIRSVQNAVHGRIFGASLSIHIGDTVFYPLYIYDAARGGFVWDSIGVER